MADITVTLNGNEVTASEDTTILQLARDNGIDIPTLCYVEDLPPQGACRLCLVEVAGSRLLVASCHTQITQGMVIETHSPKVIETRRTVIELILASHAGNCFLCEKANICELRRIAADLDIGLPRFRARKHYYPIEDENSYITRDMSKCILCRRCVIACKNLKGGNLFAVAYRGFESKVVYGCDQSIGEAVDREACRDCDVCINLCPSGALTKPRRAGEPKRGKALIISS